MEAVYKVVVAVWNLESGVWSLEAGGWRLEAGGKYFCGRLAAMYFVWAQ
jgi:hypothetical protein